MFAGFLALILANAAVGAGAWREARSGASGGVRMQIPMEKV